MFLLAAIPSATDSVSPWVRHGDGEDEDNREKEEICREGKNGKSVLRQEVLVSREPYTSIMVGDCKLPSFTSSSSSYSSAIPASDGIGNREEIRGTGFNVHGVAARRRGQGTVPVVSRKGFSRQAHSWFTNYLQSWTGTIGRAGG